MNIHPMTSRLTPLLKYPGGKEKELNHILPNIPKDASNFYEPFVGGGAVYLAVTAPKYYINDLSTELINLYRYVAEQDAEFLDKLAQIKHNWDVMSKVVNNHSQALVAIYNDYKTHKDKSVLISKIEEFINKNEIDLNGMLEPNFNVAINNFVKELVKSFTNKLVRMKILEERRGTLGDQDILTNVEGAFKSAFYMHFRYLYNNHALYKDEISEQFATAIYFYIREYCYSSMFRYNRNGKFNVPYGGISYNNKSMEKKVNYFEDSSLLNHLRNTIIGNMDFYEFMKKYPPKKDDFIFLDPPYDSEFSTYAKNEFDKSDQKRLSDYLCNECNGYFMVVIKNTDYIKSLYPAGKKTRNERSIHIKPFDKTYMVSFQDRNNRNTQHLIITNYELPGENYALY